MGWKEFFKPTITKIVLCILFSLASFFILLAVGFGCGFTDSHSFGCNVGSVVYYLILLPSYLIGSLLGIRFNPLETSAHYLLSWLVQIVYSYVVVARS